VVKDDYFSQQLKNVLAKHAERCSSTSSAILQEDKSEDTSTVTTSSQHLVYILLAPTAYISHKSLKLLLGKHVPSHITSMSSTQSPPLIHTLHAPLFAPSSAAHSVEQSTTLWPTTYNPNTTYGPNPAIVAQAREELEHNGEVDVYMTLARQVGEQAAQSRMGLPIGTVIVERIEGQGRVVAVAGDARWAGCGKDGDNGNPAGHAVLRAIDFVAQKRRATAAVDTRCVISDKGTEQSPGIHVFPAPVVSSYLNEATTKTDHTISTNYAAQVHHAALTSLEEHYLYLDSNPGALSPNGYLCLNLEVYLTHEPCVMCSMALVHSRVGRVVFGGSAGPGIATGALRAEVIGNEMDSNGERHKHDGEAGEKTGVASQQPPPPKYGLFWREDLNWRFNAWEWREGMNVMAEVDEADRDGGTCSALDMSHIELVDGIQV